MDEVRKLVAVLVASALVFSSAIGPGGTLLAAEPETQTSYSQYLAVRPGEIAGKILYPDGKTPASKVPVRVWSVTKEKFILQTTADEKGAYRLPRLAAGRYLVVYGDRVSVDLRVDDEAKQTARTLNVIIPRGKVLAADREAGELWGMTGIERGTILTSVVVFGAGAATAIGIAAATDNLGEETKKIVSP